jgi:DNA-binding NarL/FixJ family response regulator
MRVAIVDDNEQFVNAAREVLQREGATVVGIASSGAAALQVVAVSRADVVLVDVDLGHESGFAVARRVAEVADVRIVMISAHPADDFAEMVTEGVAIGFVPKAELSMSALGHLLGDGIERG